MSLPKESARQNQRARRVGTSAQSDAAYGQEGRVEAALLREAVTSRKRPSCLAQSELQEFKY